MTARKKKRPDLVLVATRVAPDLAEEFREIAAREGRSVSSELRRVIASHVDDDRKAA